MQQLETKMFKIKHGLTPAVLDRIFVVNNNSAQLGSKTELCVTKINTENSEKNALKLFSHLELLSLGNKKNSNFV